MSSSLKPLLIALKTLFREQENRIDKQSFLLLFGKQQQGLASLIAQSGLTPYPVEALEHARLYYHHLGVVLHLPEEWLIQNNELLSNSLRQIDACYPPLGISAVAMAVNLQELMIEQAQDFEARMKTHQQLWRWVQSSLPRPVPSHVILTHADALAGFCEFFHQDFRPDFQGVLGCYSAAGVAGSSRNSTMTQAFRKLLQQLDQQVLDKLHPVRSTIKRTLIREFPLQLQVLGTPLMRLVQLLQTPPRPLRAIYFTSARQGGSVIDPIHRKIQHEYALCLPSRSLQVSNNQNYFIDACVQDLLQCNPMSLPANRKVLRNLGLASILIALVTVGISTKEYWHNSQQLDAVSRELLQYESLSESGQQPLSGLYHLSQADESLQNISGTAFTPLALLEYQQNLHRHTKEKLRQVFLPELLQEAEHQIIHANSPATRHAALKTYIMLGDPTRFDQEQLTHWYQQQWFSPNKADPRLQVLAQSLRYPLPVARLNDNIIQDARNALNALPDAYFYYSMARQHFPTNSSPLSLPGFQLAQTKLPFIYTREGFASVVEQIDSIVAKIQQESWVSQRQPPEHVQRLILETYAYEYQQWWKHFLSHSRIESAENYRQVETLLRSLRENNSFIRLIQLAQQHTRPVSQDASGLFNHHIARSFTPLSWLGEASLHSLQLQQADLETFSQQLALLQDQPESILELTQQRFSNTQHSDPLSLLYHNSKEYPSPLKEWNTQLADMLWFLLIQDSKQFIEAQWQEKILPFYQDKIAHKYPFNNSARSEITLTDFYDFFKPNGKLQQFSQRYLLPFLDTKSAQWKAKEVNGYRLSLQSEAITQLMVANVLQTMFFPPSDEQEQLHFTIEKIALDPMLKTCDLQIGDKAIHDGPYQDSLRTDFTWPAQQASLELQSLDGKKWRLTEQGPWALFHLLDKVNVMVDENDPSSLQILFEINGNSGRYSLHTANPINPFIPGILGQFQLPKQLT
ncbi:MAG: hypothetical protein JJT82_06200 [Legionellaceae bacterium]|nr:hypothetical protein [Legionellaceae bacterium]